MNELLPTPDASNIFEIDPPAKRNRVHTYVEKGEPVSEMTVAANFRHDIVYGWSRLSPREYTNATRLSGYIKTPPGLANDEEVWEAIHRLEGLF